MGKSTISMAIFNSYVKLPEGMPTIAWAVENSATNHFFASKSQGTSSELCVAGPTLPGTPGVTIRNPHISMGKALESPMEMDTWRGNTIRNPHRTRWGMLQHNMRDDESTKSHRKKKNNQSKRRSSRSHKCIEMSLCQIRITHQKWANGLLTSSYSSWSTPCPLSVLFTANAGMGHSWSFKISLECHNDVSQNSQILLHPCQFLLNSCVCSCFSAGNQSFFREKLQHMYPLYNHH